MTLTVKKNTVKGEVIHKVNLLMYFFLENWQRNSRVRFIGKLNDKI
jgi:hypothetical protein